MSDQPGTGVPRQPGEPRMIARSDWWAEAGPRILAEQERRKEREAAEAAEAARLDAYYTNETLMLVAKVLHDGGCPSGASCSDSPTTWTRYVRDACEVLRALAADGWIRRDRIDLGNPLGWTPEQIRQHEEWNAQLGGLSDEEEA